MSDTVESNITMCNDCKGLADCSKYCLFRQGYNLVNFISKADFVDTSIGDMRQDIYNKIQKLMVLGILLDGSNNPTDLVCSIDSPVELPTKFKMQDDTVTLDSILHEYFNRFKLDDTIKNKMVQTLFRVNSTAYLSALFKANIRFSLLDKNGVVTAHAGCKSVQWLFNKNTSCLEYVLFLEPDSDFDGTMAYRSLKMPVVNYGTKFLFEQVELTYNANETVRELISVTNDGLVKPIVVMDGKHTLAIDGMFLYEVVDGETLVVGRWEDCNLISVQDGLKRVKKYKAYKVLDTGLKYIYFHKRFIVPYKFYDENIINLSDEGNAG